MAKDRKYTIMVVPEDGEDTRTYHLSVRGVRWLVGGGLAGLLLLLLLVGSWGYLAVGAYRAAELEAELEGAVQDRERLERLAATVQEVEERYEHLRGLFAPEGGGEGGGLRLPSPSSGAGTPAPRSVQEEEAFRPTSWPLTERGVVTQPLLQGGGEGHPGIDIAVPTGAYIRAAGSGTVVEVGEDPTYGRFLILDHGEGYRTLYAHAYLLLAERDRRVRRNEVIGLTGSTGRSSAPHLHFEILRDGEAIDPFSMVSQP